MQGPGAVRHDLGQEFRGAQTKTNLFQGERASYNSDLRTVGTIAQLRPAQSISGDGPESFVPQHHAAPHLSRELQMLLKQIPACHANRLDVHSHQVCSLICSLSAKHPERTLPQRVKAVTRPRPGFANWHRRSRKSREEGCWKKAEVFFKMLI